MSNFLHNLRQRQQNNQNNNYHDRRSQNDRRNNTNYNNNNKVVPKVIQNKISEEIKTQLENISKNLAAQSKIVEKRIRIEERSADVMEKIVELLESSDVIKSILGGVNVSNSDVEAHDDQCLNPKKEIEIEESIRREIIETVFEMRNAGATYSEIASYLDSQNYPTFSGKGKWHAQTVHRLYQKYD